MICRGPPLLRPCHCDAVRMDSDAVEGLEKGFQRLRLAPAPTLLRKHLSKRVFALLKYKATPLGANLYDAVRIGMLHHDSLVGAFAPDQYAYEVYSVLLDPLMDERHFGFDLTDVHPPDDWGYKRLKYFPALDPEKKYIIASRVRCSRNLDGYRFTPTMCPEELKEVERVCVELLYRLPWEYSGKYMPYQCIPQSLREELSNDHCFFDEPDKYEITGNVRQHWPVGRGVYVNSEHTFAVLVNEKDHLRVIALEEGENLTEAYKRVACATPVLDRRLTPAAHERLGYLTVCPGDVGTGLRVSVLMHMSPGVPRYALAEVANTYHLEIKYMENETACVSNLRTLGVSQYEILKDFHHGVREVIRVAHFHTPKKEPEEKEEVEEEEESDGEREVCPKDEEYEEAKEISQEPDRLYEMLRRTVRRQRQVIREANRRRIARDGNLRKKSMRDWPPAKDRLFPRRRRKDACPKADTGKRFPRHINDRKCVSEVSEVTIEAGGLGSVPLGGDDKPK